MVPGQSVATTRTTVKLTLSSVLTLGANAPKYCHFLIIKGSAFRSGDRSIELV